MLFFNSIIKEFNKKEKSTPIITMSVLFQFRKSELFFYISIYFFRKFDDKCVTFFIHRSF